MSNAKHPSLLAVADKLGALGFTKRTGWTFTRDLGSEVLGWIGLNTASHHSPAGEVLVNPSVGVRHQEVERCVAEGRGEKFEPYGPPTYSEPLSTIASGVGPNDFTFDGTAADASVISSLINSLASDGETFMEGYADLTRVAEPLGRYFLRNQAARYRYPVVLWQQGRPAEASEAIEAARHSLGDRDDPAAVEQQAFFDWLTGRLADPGPRSS